MEAAGDSHVVASVSWEISRQSRVGGGDVERGEGVQLSVRTGKGAS